MASRIGEEIEISPVELASRLARKSKINLASGSPDPRLIPLEEIRRAYDEVIEKYKSAAFSYPGAGGQEELVKEIEMYLSKLGLNKGEDEVVVTSGAQHAMELLGKYFLEGDVIAVENPTFIETFNSLKLRSSSVIPISLDEKGIVMEQLRQMLKLVKVKLLYVIPNCHNPAGVNMSDDRRREIAELAEQYDFYVIEDDPYRPIAGEVPPPIKGYDRYGRVIYVSSFSKILAPGLRIGFILAKKEIAEKVSLLEQLDFSTSTINQYVVAMLLKNQVVTSRMGLLAGHYKRKLELMSKVLREEGFHRFNKAECGFFQLIDLEKDSWKVFQEAVKMGLSFVPAKPFFLKGGETMARLSVSVASEEEIVEGVRLLRKAVDKV
ncbi:MAG: GntR family transcriptional regulator [Candidatus Aramenus sulfurataquae]|jgi:DNA-binding transcriptional MocR family regulator|uniref:GntR family transcriptional regulator n=2 Tax=Candidatus Aramenus sulfurataquae TaxID=1326980 RepID=W7KJA2_9CREN|nr:MAG: GntR family transcriptional regulator [Candidatus Aramenus sulfurataquae]MCL7343190.1 PLP-dependent aminotransferase family protein [Candidatus Aramenus sulfurataquae]